MTTPSAGPESDEENWPPPPRLLDHLRSSASGLIAGASDVDPTTVATMAVIGATTVYGLSWLAILIFPILAVIQAISSRIGVVTHEDLQYLVKRRFGRVSQLLLLGSILVVTVITIAAVVLLARRQRGDVRAAVAVLVAGGVLAAPHALPTDLVLVALALAIWGKAQWYDWLLLSVGAAIAAFMPAPVPAVTGVVVVGWVCLRAAGWLTWSRREPAPMSTG